MSGYIDRNCFKCGKRVRFFEKRGRYLEVTPDVIVLSHHYTLKCMGKIK